MTEQGHNHCDNTEPDDGLQALRDMAQPILRQEHYIWSRISFFDSPVTLGQIRADLEGVLAQCRTFASKSKSKRAAHFFKHIEDEYRIAVSGNWQYSF